MTMKATCVCGRSYEITSSYAHEEEKIDRFFARHEACLEPRGVVLNTYGEQIVEELHNINEHLLALRNSIGKQAA